MYFPAGLNVLQPSKNLRSIQQQVLLSHIFHVLNTMLLLKVNRSSKLMRTEEPNITAITQTIIKYSPNWELMQASALHHLDSISSVMIYIFRQTNNTYLHHAGFRLVSIGVASLIEHLYTSRPIWTSFLRGPCFLINIGLTVNNKMTPYFWHDACLTVKRIQPHFIE